MYSFAVVGCSAAIYFLTRSFASNSTYLSISARRGSPPPNGGRALASAIQNTKKVATYVPSMASGTTFIVFSTATNSTIITAILAVSPTKNFRTMRCGSVAVRPPNPSIAIARLAIVLIPPPNTADSAAWESAISHAASAQIKVTAAWPSTTLRASRRAMAKSIAITLYPARGARPAIPQPGERTTLLQCRIASEPKVHSRSRWPTGQNKPRHYRDGTPLHQGVCSLDFLACFFTECGPGCLRAHPNCYSSPPACPCPTRCAGTRLWRPIYRPIRAPGAKYPDLRQAIPGQRGAD